MSRARRPHKCPYCLSTDTVRIVYGFPSAELVEQAEREEVALGGCIVSDNDPNRTCNTCGESFSTRAVRDVGN